MQNDKINLVSVIKDIIFTLFLSISFFFILITFKHFSMKHWTLKVNLSVADSWVADGFDCKDRIDQIEEQIAGLLPYAYGHEVIVKVTILDHPTDKAISDLQDGTVEAAE